MNICIRLKNRFHENFRKCIIKMDSLSTFLPLKEFEVLVNAALLT